MSYDQHQEKQYSKDVTSIYKAALAAVEKLDGHLVSSLPEEGKLEVKFPKTVLGKTLGERTYLSFEARVQGPTSLVVVDAYPLDAIERKLLFGARKGVTQTMVNWFIEELDRKLA
jgi:hypothetical protein